jgi:hypothetical protein
MRTFDCPVPDRVKALPADPRGYPIPWFVHVDGDGKAHFPVMEQHKIHDAIRAKRCWVCGGTLGTLPVPRWAASQTTPTPKGPAPRTRCPGS